MKKVNGKSVRDYGRENKLVNSKPSEIKKRVERNKARAMMIKAGKVKVGDKLDVDHKKPLSQGGTTTPNNLVAISMAANRSFSRNKDSSIKSQRSKREKKK
jgi:hypothetical protein